MCLQKLDCFDWVKARIVHPMMRGAEARQVFWSAVGGIVIEMCDLQTRTDLDAAYGTASKRIVFIRDSPRLSLIANQ